MGKCGPESRLNLPPSDVDGGGRPALPPQRLRQGRHPPHLRAGGGSFDRARRAGVPRRSQRLSRYSNLPLPYPPALKDGRFFLLLFSHHRALSLPALSHESHALCSLLFRPSFPARAVQVSPSHRVSAASLYIYLPRPSLRADLVLLLGRHGDERRLVLAHLFNEDGGGSM